MTVPRIVALAALALVAGMGTRLPDESGPGQPLRDLRLAIRPKSLRCVLDQPMVIEGEVKNIGRGPIVLSKCTKWDVTGIGPSSEEKTEPPAMIADCLRAKSRTDFSVLAPGASLRREWDVSRTGLITGAGTWRVDIREVYPFDGAEFGIAAWTGALRSNRVAFEVVKGQ